MSTSMTPDGRRERWHEHRTRREADLVDKMIAAVRELGPDCYVEEMAAHAGVAKALLYRYFGDKAGLHQVVSEELARRVVEHTTEAVLAADLPEEKLAAGLATYVDLVCADRYLYTFVVHRKPPRRTPVRPEESPADHFAVVSGEIVAGVISERLRAYGLPDRAARPWGFGIVGLVRDATDQWMAEPTMTSRELVAHLVDLVGPGLLSVMRSAEVHATRP